MIERSAILSFPRTLVGKPVISGMIRKYSVEVNIIQAQITPEEDGYMFAMLSGERKAVEDSLAYLRKKDIKVVLPDKNLIWDEEKCVHCTACVGQCGVSAFSVEAETLKVSHVGSRCIGCKLCISACSYGALAAASHLEVKGGFDDQNI